MKFFFYENVVLSFYILVEIKIWFGILEYFNMGFVKKIFLCFFRKWI